MRKNRRMKLGYAVTEQSILIYLLSAIAGATELYEDFGIELPTIFPNSHLTMSTFFARKPTL